MTARQGGARPRGRRAALLERAQHQRLEAFPASSGQRRLWLLDRLFPGSAAYNMPLALRLQGPLHPPAVAASLEAIARRHEPLRTALIAVDGEPMQVIRPPQRIPLAIVDLGGVVTAHAGAAAREIAAREAARPFDLAAGRLLRALLIRLAADDHVLLLAVHHAASDEWSQGILVDELAELYRAGVAGRPAPLPALPARYLDFALWQRRWLESEACRSALAFWRERLGDLPPATEIAGDHARPMRPTFHGERESRALPLPLAAALRQAAGRERVTLFVLLLAAFETLLARLTGNADLVIGSPVANRHHLQTESLIGFFVNTLVLRTDLGGNPTLREVVARVRETVIAAIDHQDLPFERLVEELNPPRDLSRSPLFQISFTLQVERARAGAGEPQPVRVSPWMLGRPTSKFDLSLFMSERGEDLLVAMEWSRDLFEHATIERLLSRLEIVLRAMAASRETPLWDLELLASWERHQLLGEWSAGDAAAPPPPLQERIEAWASEMPEDPAVICGDQRWSCGELNARANRLARHLRSIGVGRGDRVAVLLEREPEVVGALLAVLKAGACYLPLDPSYPAERLALLLADAGAKVVLTRPPFSARLGGGAARVLNLDALPKAVARRSAADLRLPVDPLDLAYVIYTSGSTGRPKGVLVPHQALSAYLAWCLRRYGLSHGRGAPVHTSLGFDLTVTSLLAPLWARCPAILVPDALGLDGLRAVLAPAVDLSVLKLTPAHLDVLGAWLGDGELEASIGCLVVGGEALHAATLAVWHAVAPATRVINEYGPTEATVGCSVHEVSAAEPPRDPVPIGRPIDGARLRVLDGNLRPVPIGVAGDLWIGGSGLARGYLDDPALTASSFRPDPFAERAAEPGARLYRSGDRARYLPDGTLEFLGRTDEQLKVRGYRIEPAEVETALTANPLVREAVVVGAHAAGGETELVAWVVPAAPGPLPIARLRSDLAERLPAYMVPGHFEVAEQLPLTAHGKVDRKALAATDATDRLVHGSGEDVVRPRSLVQHQILEIWREVLGERAQGITDDFFEKGGTSLSAVRVLARMRRRFGLEVPLSAFFQARTVEALARWLREADPAGRSPLVEMQQGQGELPICLVHPVGGAVLCYVPLLRHLGAQQSVIGFEAREDVPYDSFEEIAADYIDLLGAKLPRAPRLLFGWSFGGTLAYEMACQLARRGETPEMLVLLDSVAPRRDEPVEEALLEKADIMDDAPAFLDALERALGLRLPITGEQLALVPRERQLAALLEAGRRIHVLPAEIEIEEVAHALANFRRLLALARAWQPRPYRGPMTLLRASAVESWVSAAGRQLREGDPTLGWGRLAARTEVLFLPGTHASLVIEPDVGAVGRLLRTRIDEILDRSRAQGDLVLEAAE